MSQYVHNAEVKGNPFILLSVTLHLALPPFANQASLPRQLKTSGPHMSQVQVRDTQQGTKPQN